MDQEPQSRSLEFGTGITVLNNPKPKTRKRLIIIVVVLLVVIVVSLLLYFYHFHNHKVISKAQSTSQKLTPYQQYQVLANQGKYASAEQVLKQQLAKTTNVNDKITIYYQQSDLALSFKQYTDAEKYANEAKKLAPNSATPYVALAQLAAAQGNKTLAKQDWQQAITNLNPNVTGYNLIKQEYQTNLDALQ